MARWLIENVTISGGFLAGIDLRLHDGLTCIIGPRGSGKSTFAEAIRFALQGMPASSRARTDRIQANLVQALITLKTSPDVHGEWYTIQRQGRQPVSLTSKGSKPLTTIELERGTFLPIDAYESSEIEEIADESLGDKRRNLLDDLVGEELRQVSYAAAELRRSLEANAAAIREAERTRATLSEQIEEIGDARGRLAALPPVQHGEADPALLASTTQQQVNEREKARGQAVESGLDSLAGVVADLPGRLAPLLVTAPGPLSRNAETMDAIGMEIEGAIEDVRVVAGVLEHKLRDRVARVRELRSGLEGAHALQKAEFDRHQSADLASSQAIRERHAREQEVVRLAGLEGRKAETIEAVVRLKEEREGLRGGYLLQRERITRLREATAARLQQEAGQKVRIQVQENADISGYQQKLLEGLKGAGVRNHEDILNSLLRLRPEDLAQAVRDGDVEEFEQQAGLGGERSRKILQAFAKNLDPYALELLPVDDLVRIELNVAAAGDPYFKDAADLSRGQKCTALLPILLARRDVPLLVDQPEDNLDNHFIYETIVESIRRLKGRRQMVFVTHNANIPVLGEADLVVVMNSDGKRGYVEKLGSLDDCRQEIIDLLEGGEEAFNLRRERYAKQ
jgi:energy-coupling factor transporter ATP-binding protein EcfA2